MIDKVAIMNEARAKCRLEHEDTVRERAKLFFEQYKNEPLFVAGIMLYWTEGKTTDRETCNLELNNSDPKLLILYCRFLRNYLRLDDSMLRVRLFLYPDLDEGKTKLFWSNLLNIPLTQFIKSYIGDSRSSITKHKLAYGTCSLYITRKDLRLTVATWIELFANLHTSV